MRYSVFSRRQQLKLWPTGDPGPYTRPRQSQTYAFSGSDGLPFAIHLSSPQKFWEGLCNSVGHPELIEDPRFNTRPNRRKNYDELSKTFAELFKEKPRAYWMEQLEANDVPYAPVYNLAEVFQDPQIQHMGLRFKSIGKTSRPLKLSSSRWNIAMIKANIPRRRRI